MIENLIGQTFGYLTVLDGPIKKGKDNFWKCQCKCGAIREVRNWNLKSGNTKSCGCYKKSVLIKENKKRQTVDLTNKRFGKLIALEPTDKRTNDGRVIWKCKCDCGNIIEADTHALQEGRKTSCGCLKSKGEYYIELLLKENNIQYVKQYSFPDCKFPKSNYLAKFDFYINNSYLIEYDGEQHFYYTTNTNTWNTKENYLKVQTHDEYKNNWCKVHNIPLIRIPYTHLKDLSINDLKLETSNFVI